MNAQELRIGNFVASEGFPLMKVMAILQFNRFYLTTVEGDDYSADFSIERSIGIPLTEEWLKRFGFEKRKKQFSISVGGELMYYWMDAVKVVFYEVNPSTLTMDSVYKNPAHTQYNNNRPSLNITTVHQLQNLYFALTGTELTLTPPL